MFSITKQIRKLSPSVSQDKKKKRKKNPEANTLQNEDKRNEIT